MARKSLLFVTGAVLFSLAVLPVSCGLFSKSKTSNMDTYDLTGDNSGIEDMDGAAGEQNGEAAAAKPAQSGAAAKPAQSGAAAKPDAAAKSGTSFSEIKNRLWRLSELWSGPGKVVFDRAKMAAAGLDDVYTLQFIDTGVNGKAAPNRYFAAYDVPYDMNAYLEGHNLALRPLLGTQLAATINVGALMEGEYYYYLQRVNRWDLVDGKLQLYADITVTDSVTLCFE